MSRLEMTLPDGRNHAVDVDDGVPPAGWTRPRRTPDEVYRALFSGFASTEDRTVTDTASDYGRLLAERDRLIADGTDPADLEMPLPPLPSKPAHLCPHDLDLRLHARCYLCEPEVKEPE